MTVHRDYHGYKLIEDDLLSICEFIEPTDANKETYSHRIYELFLRVCTEFESHAKERLIHYGYPKALSTPNDLKINDYKTLYTDNNFLGDRLSAEIGLKFWSPSMIYITPFQDWINGNRLSWYQAYNDVKHNRDTNFKDASLWNLIRAYAGLSLILFQSHRWSFFQPYAASLSARGGGAQGFTGNGCLFWVRGPGAGVEG
ncbi:MAG: hypothetical protein B7Y39_08655 [Bdellovibrio sp. 28-41-41]|nr:MAG: hypothetical protein B7Y39_08655 [Bdellovibrio sp. 28-41-41]